MKKLNERLWAVAKEYTAQVAELLGCSEWHWIGTDDDGKHPLGICDFGDVIFLTLEDMQVIIDRFGEWVERWGSKEAVAERINGWFDWWLAEASEAEKPGTVTERQLLEQMERRKNRCLKTYPLINLTHWLMGCPIEHRQPTIDDELQLLVCQRDMVRELITKYREARTLWNIFDNLDAEIKEKQKTKESRDAKLAEDKKLQELRGDFEKIIDDLNS